jgi:uncharacterized Zn finger protein
VNDGIRARSKRGGFARSWWARRWLAVLEALQVGGRLARGRSYARRGQVMDIEIAEGLVLARVQGSREEPYDVVLRVARLLPAEWSRLAEVLAGEAVFLARLLAGQMPEDIETAFAAAGLSLFPSRLSELETSCSCPDVSNPCKHIAAVYYLLGEEFERDPFLIFRLRGITRDELMRAIDAIEEASRRRARVRARRSVPPAARKKSVSRRKAASFWHPRELPPDLLPEPEPPEQASALLARLGPFPFWRGREPLPDALRPAYERAAAAAVELLAALSSPPGTEPRK